MGDQEFKRLEVKSSDALERWLARNHRQTDSIWLVTWKKAYADKHVSYDEIVDLCLCYGWIDSAVRKLDDKRSMLRLSPRNKKSNWSAANKTRASRLIHEQRMQPSGQAMIELAKQSGTWTFLDDVDALILPADLSAALAAEPAAENFFDRFPASSKRGILEWIKMARTTKTRSRRITETVAKAAQNRKANFPVGRDAGPQA